jgi:glycosyltransferase involved in cell wall biosynthesis
MITTLVAASSGARLLLPAAERARLPWPLVVVGDGAARAQMEADARRLGRDVRLLGWLARDEALAWLGHASVLVFPSYGPESLSRVLLEAGALGVPTAAMNTGGTPDIVRHGITGLLSRNLEELGRHVATLVTDRALADRLGRAAREHVDGTFATPRVVERIERLYQELCATSHLAPFDLARIRHG